MNTEGVRDPFAARGADHLGFLSESAPMPVGSLPLLRGHSRIFDATHLAIANEGASAHQAASQGVAAAQVGDIVAAPGPGTGAGASDATNLYGVDLTTMTVEQLGDLMSACAAQMIRSTLRAAVPPGP